jgi:pSer/pThr/pTyr-binding forkhead associated (FHA) protein
MLRPSDLAKFVAEAYLEAANAAHTRHMFNGDTITVGSGSDCSISIDNLSVSRRHARFRKIGNYWWVEDAGSTNGTWVNGARIDRPTRMLTGDKIAFGGARFFFCGRSLLQRVITLHPYEFEKLVAELFARLGFESAVTKQTGDGGVDVIAVNKGVIFRGKYLVQCKRYSISHKVSLPEVMSFFGRIAAEHAKGIFVTSSNFTRHAKQFAESNGINLIDGEELKTLVQRHQLL